MVSVLSELQGKNILVTGGAGFIGSNLVDRLILENPGRIAVIDNLFLGKLSNLEYAKSNVKNFQLFIKDASIFSNLKRVIRSEKIDIVFDLATIPLPTSYIKPRFTFETNIKIVMNLCELLRQDEFELYGHCSSSEAYGSGQYFPMAEDHPLNPTTTYGASKASQDILIQAYDKMYDLNYFIFRPFNNFGERQNDQAYAALIPITIKKILRGEKPTQHGDGKQTRDYIYVKDTVDAVVKLAKSPKSRKQVTNVSRGKEIEVETVIRTICKKIGYKGEIEVVPNPRLTDVKRHWSSNQKLKSMIDFNPTPFEAAISNVIDYYSTGEKKVNDAE